MKFGRYRCDHCRHRAQAANWLTLPVLFVAIVGFLAL
jgi:hypothetical protein